MFCKISFYILLRRSLRVAVFCYQTLPTAARRHFRLVILQIANYYARSYWNLLRARMTEDSIARGNYFQQRTLLTTYRGVLYIHIKLRACYISKMSTLFIQCRTIRNTYL
jgi:hypothetical protein